MSENGGGAGIDLATPMPVNARWKQSSAMRSQLSSQSPVLRLPLPEELEIEVPDALDRLHPVVGAVLAPHRLNQPRRRRRLAGRRRLFDNGVGHLNQATAQRDNQPIGGLQVSFGRRRRSVAELDAAKRAQRGGVPAHIHRLHPQPRPQGVETSRAGGYGGGRPRSLHPPDAQRARAHQSALAGGGLLPRQGASAPEHPHPHMGPSIRRAGLNRGPARRCSAPRPP